ncbi:putative ribonuclease H-like domain-containing protein, partial [Tanacetum coccineum]
RDYSNARTPQQNGVAERKNRTLIEAARTMLADSKLPTVDRDANEKHLIQVLKIHADENVVDLLTKAFDGPRFNL